MLVLAQQALLLLTGVLQWLARYISIRRDIRVWTGIDAARCSDLGKPEHVHCHIHLCLELHENYHSPKAAELSGLVHVPVSFCQLILDYGTYSSS